MSYVFCWTRGVLDTPEQTADPKTGVRAHGIISAHRGSDMTRNSLSRITRKTFLKTAAVFSANALSLDIGGAQSRNESLERAASEPYPVTLDNAHWQLGLKPGAGLKAQVVHKPSGIVLAQGDYSYSVGNPFFGEPQESQESKAKTVTLKGAISGGLELQHEFKITAEEPWMEEQITLSNRGTAVQALPYGRCGFVLPLTLEGGAVSGPLRDFRVTAVPYRREPSGNRTQYADYTLLQVLSEPRSSHLRAETPVERVGNVVLTTVYASGIIQTLYPFYASEGWILTDGRQGFLLTKYSQQGMEWAILDRAPVDDGRAGFRWGGFGIFQGDPEHGAWLAPQQSHRFGITRITAFEGGIEEGFYTFRAEMETRGHGCPKGFNPPVHWNELYDNKLWWLPGGGMDLPENRKKYYTLVDMTEEAAKARNMGCEALYLDPGWDTRFASKIWDETRLGKLKDFTARLRREYGLSLSLHTPLSGWCDPSSYSRGMDRMNRDGSRVPGSLCGASMQYVEETCSRLEALARDGARFFMFDGTMQNGECWDPQHGHRVPSGREEHVEATNKLARQIHAKYPQVLIEMHDQMLGGTRLRYVPTYYGQGWGGLGEKAANSAGFDSVWAFELMWDPMTDLVGGHSIALYYYNLAYSLPLYLHIDLRKDNDQCLMFWWNASTCRHLGIGGTHADPRVQKAQKDAMAAYRRLETLFKAGTFYGLDEMVHVHVHPTEPAAVINCFNLEDHAVNHRIELFLGKVGLEANRSYQIKGATARRAGDQYLLEVAVPSYGHSLIELRGA